MPIDEPVVPGEATHLWAWFWELNQARVMGQWSANPITFTEIDAWCRLTGVRLDPWELETIRQMDAAFLAGLADRSRQLSKASSNQGPPTSQPVSGLGAALRRRMKTPTKRTMRKR